MPLKPFTSPAVLRNQRIFPQRTVQSVVHCTREFLRTPQGSLSVCGAFFSLEVPSGYVKIAIENYSDLMGFNGI